MDISSIVSSLVSQSFSSKQQSTSGTTDLAAAAFGKASKRVQQQLSSTQVQLSAFGQIQGSFAEVQTTAKSLSDAKLSTNELKTAIGGFVDAFNKANKSVSSATQKGGNQSGALANDLRATFAGKDLQRSIATGTTLTDLSKIGITQNKDGSLSVDTKALDTALQANPTLVRSTAASVGSRVEKAVTSELANSGNVGRSVNSLSQRSRALEAQQSSQQAQIANAQQLIDQQTSQINNISKLGISAYLKTFTG